MHVGLLGSPLKLEGEVRQRQVGLMYYNTYQLTPTPIIEERKMEEERRKKGGRTEEKKWKKGQERKKNGS